MKTLKTSMRLLSFLSFSFTQPAYAQVDTTARAIAAKAYVIANALANHNVPIPISLPSVSGSTVVGSLIKADPGNWIGSPTFLYQWQRNGVAIVGATLQNYTLLSDDAGTSLTLQLSAVNSTGTTQVSTTSLTIPAVNPPAPPVTIPPVQNFSPSLDHSDSRNSQYL